MRIAQVSSIYEDTPPKLYGGTERVVSSITEGLIKNGHDVTLFATGSSQTKAKLVSVIDGPLYRKGIGKSNLTYPLLNFTEAFERQDQFDILHFHLSLISDYTALLGAKYIPTKTLFTIHFTAPEKKGYPDRHLLLEKYKQLNFVSISKSHRDGFPSLNWLGTVYNGIELSQLTFNATPKDYALWLGKFRIEKGAKEAILAAKKAGIKLILAGGIDIEDERDHRYYENEVKPLIDGKQIVFVGEKGGMEKDELLGNAICLLNPINWDEPFGLAPVEAMATGTPVISFKRGALAETVKDGETGYLVDGLEGMVQRITQIKQINRAACRKHVEENFSAEKMVKEYEKLYELLSPKQ